MLGAAALHARFSLTTVVVTWAVFVLDSVPSLTTRLNVSGVVFVMFGAVNVGFAGLLVFSVTVGPAICVQV